MSNIDKLVESLRTVEGDKVHYNKGEEDITSPFGIYRKQHPSASIFSYLDEVASNNNISKPSKEWNTDEIKIVNDNLDNNKVFELAKDFYKDFTNLDLDKLPIQTSLAYFNIFTNTPLGANKAIQKAVNGVIDLFKLDNPKLKIDGVIGNKTKEAVYSAASRDDKLFKILFLLGVEDYYIDLAIKNPDKYLQYLKGWNNRVNNLIKDA